MVDILGNYSKLRGDKRKRRVARRQEIDFSYSQVALKTRGKIEPKQKLFSSLFSLKAVIVLLFCLLIFKIFSLQVVKGEVNQNLAEGNRIRPRLVEASRGLILDKNGEWLAKNKPDFALALFPSDLPKDKLEREKIFQRISDISGLTLAEINAQIQKNTLSSVDAVIIKDNLEPEEALLLEERTMGIPGVFVNKKFKREYLTLPGLSHILGYTGMVSKEDLEKGGYYMTDWIGKTGLEYQYENYLKGIHGIEQIEVDSKGNVVRVLVKEGSKDPIAGDDIMLYLDKDLQEKSAQFLKEGMAKASQNTGEDINAGVAIVMDVKTGGILSMVSLPDFDNNLFTKKISEVDYKKLTEDKSFPMFNRAIKGVYPPGSIIKIVMASAGLTEGNITLNTSFDTPEAIMIGDYRFPDWKDHGVTDVKRAIAESNNVFFYSIGGGYENIQGLGIDKIKQYWQLFGLGNKSNIDLPGEATGLLPDPAWKEETKKEPWYLGDTYHVSIGQGDLLVTPIQMAKIVSAFANNGTLLSPQLLRKVVDQNGKTVFDGKPKVEKTAFLPDWVIKTVRDGMRLTVTDGSARSLNDLPVAVAGKTGTAQFFNNQKTHAWFVSFAPFDDPQIAVVVLVEGGGGGNDIAAPIAKEILKYYFQK